MKQYICFIFLLLSIAGTEISAVTTGAEFLKLSLGARPTGMGDSFVAIANDVTAIYWNPAGLANVSKAEAQIMHSDAILDASIDFLAFAYPTVSQGTFSLGTIIYTIKPIPVTLQSGAVLGDLNWQDIALVFSYGNKINENLCYGVGSKFIKRKESDPIFGTSEGTAYALDAGILYDPPIKNVHTGVAVLNTGTDIQMSGETKKDSLPQTLRAGWAYNYVFNEHLQMSVVQDFHKILHSKWYGSLGAEFMHQQQLFFRIGYYKKDGNINGITYGLGFKLKQLRIDYSNVPASELVGYTRNNKISLTFQFK